MAELTANAIQTVQPGLNVLFTDVPISGQREGIIHREGSGIVTLRNRSCSGGNFFTYKINFGANVAIPTDGTVSTPVSYAIAIDGEPVLTHTMIVTPAAVNQYWNISTTLQINLPRGCCYTVSVQNVGTEASNIQNAHLNIDPIV